MSTTLYLALDLEVCTWSENINEQFTPGISCIGFMADSWDAATVAYAGMPNTPEPRPMNKEELEQVYIYVSEFVQMGFKIVTWNGLKFDLAIMASEHPERKKDYAKWALENHIDPMFYIVCHKGYGVKLDAVSKGLGLPGKMEGITGADAPRLWMEGDLEDRYNIMLYVGQDARATWELIKKAEETGILLWNSKKGIPMSLPYQSLTVQECMTIPLPDTSWMTTTNAFERENFYRWVEEILK